MKAHPPSDRLLSDAESETESLEGEVPVGAAAADEFVVSGELLFNRFGSSEVQHKIILADLVIAILVCLQVGT